MAKSKGGLPPGFNLSVSSEELLGKPAQVGGYLDEDPLLDLIKAQRQRAQQNKVAEVEPIPAAISQAPIRQEQVNPPSPQAPVGSVVASSIQDGVGRWPEASRAPQQPASNVDPVVAPPQPRVTRPPIRRLQVNLTPDSERQINELIDIISAQSAEKNVTFSEIVNGLIHNLYESRSDLNVSRVPTRGKWGAPTAKSFPIALSQAFREAIVSFGIKVGANQFKKVMGG